MIGIYLKQIRFVSKATHICKKNKNILICSYSFQVDSSDSHRLTKVLVRHRQRCTTTLQNEDFEPDHTEL